MHTVCMTAALLVAAAGTEPWQQTDVAVVLAEQEARAALNDGENPQFFRYLQIPDGDEMKARAMGYFLNEVLSRHSVCLHPKLFADKTLLRIDLSKWTDNPERDLQKMVDLWEGLSVDEPYFLLEAKTTDLIFPEGFDGIEEEKDGMLRLRAKVPFKHTDGQTYTSRWFHRADLKGKTKRILGPHIGRETALSLTELTVTNVPIVRADWFLQRLGSTIDRGKYYEFMGIERKPAKGTARDAFLIQFGFDPAFVAKLAHNPQQKTAQLFSGVTGRERVTIFGTGSGVRLEHGQGLITITQDGEDDNTDPKADGIKNLKAFKVKAEEIIVERANGLHAYGLFNGAGELQDEVPPNIAKDHHVPVPYTARLVPPISCQRCHNKGKDAGWKSVENDVQDLMAEYLDIFGEKNSKNIPKDVAEVASLYVGSLRKPLSRARDDYSEAIVRATGDNRWKEVSDAYVDMFEEYKYGRIDAEIACRELGVAIPEGVPAGAALRQAMAFVNAFDEELGVFVENPYIAALLSVKKPKKISRLQFEQVYVQMRFRILERRRLMQ